jgi:hypothetical protein
MKICISYRTELESAATWTDSYTRLPVLLNLAPTTGCGEEIWNTWFSALGDEWSACDNVGVHKASLYPLLVKHRDCWPLMMTDDERAILAALPDTVTLFRGCGPKNKLGLSWSLSREVAERFPFSNRYRTTKPRIVTAHVTKKRIVGIKTDRSEDEVIALVRPADLVADEQLKAKLEASA